jgi:hypothetical protein
MPSRQPNTLPVEQIHAFWAEVEENLRSRHHLKGDRPVRAILRYRNEIERVGAILYHRNAEDVADDIVSGEYVAAERKVG